MVRDDRVSRHGAAEVLHRIHSAGHDRIGEHRSTSFDGCVDRRVGDGRFLGRGRWTLGTARRRAVRVSARWHGKRGERERAEHTRDQEPPAGCPRPSTTLGSDVPRHTAQPIATDGPAPGAANCVSISPSHSIGRLCNSRFCCRPHRKVSGSRTLSGERRVGGRIPAPPPRPLDNR